MPSHDPGAAVAPAKMIGCSAEPSAERAAPPALATTSDVPGSKARRADDARRPALGGGERLPPRLVESLDRAVASLASERMAVASDPVRLHVDDRPTQAWMVGSEVGPHVGVLRREVEPPLSELADLGLSPREVEVALALADGGTNERLARRLGIAVGTLRKHLERVYAVLDVSDRTSAAACVRALALGRAASRARR